MKIAVIGAGSWGTAIARILCDKYSNVTLWVRDPARAEEMGRTKINSRYLPEVVFPSTIDFTSDLGRAVEGAEVIVMVIPSQAVRETARKLAPLVSASTVIVSATKGFELSTLKRTSEVLAEELPPVADKIAVLSGPNHAEEVGLKYPTATVIATPYRKLAERLQGIFMQPYFRVYTNPDIIGVELGGALKNIVALGTGIADGLGFGDNTKAALMTRGLAEITRLGMALGASPLTFAGLAGIGDLIATCTSRHSRNRRAGIKIAQGYSVRQIEAESSMVVEGFRTVRAAYKLAVLHQIPMPITEQTFFVLYENKPAKDAVLDLMARGRKHEVEEVVLESGKWRET